MTKRKKRVRIDFLYRKFPDRMRKKLVFMFLIIILAFICLIGRVIYINTVKGKEYTKIVLEQQEYGSRVIPYKRGSVLDRNGTKIAFSERVYNVILDVFVMTSEEENIEPTIKVLRDVFGISEEKVKETIKEYPESRYQIMAKGVSYEKAQEFKQLWEDDENYPNVSGIWLEEDYKRIYPYGSLASDVIGFTVAGNQGALGIESAYDDVLNGTDGREYGYFGTDSVIKRTVKAARNGNDTVSTLDITLESMVAKKIKAFNEEHAGEFREDEGGSKNTAVMIMDPNSGEILVEESYPNFDLNHPRDIGPLYTKEKIGEMTDKEKLDNMYALWRNFCVSDTFEPGSTIKPFTVAAGLETGAIKGDETYECTGSLKVEDTDIACHDTSGHGTVSVTEAVAQSCNVALMHIADAVGSENFIRYQHIFGFGEYTGIDLPGEASTAPLLYTPDTMHSVELATNSFGQGFNVTMTQLAAGFCSLINGGNYYKPHMVKRIQDESGNVIETKDPVLLKKTVSSETSRMLKEYMREVMVSGTGKRADIEGYDIGAKTGTAEKLPRNEGNYVLSFIGYAPQENPEVVVYVVIDEPNVPDQDSSKYVLDLAKSIMEEAFPYMNITKAPEGAE